MRAAMLPLMLGLLLPLSSGQNSSETTPTPETTPAPETAPSPPTPETVVVRPKVETTEPKSWEVKYRKGEAANGTAGDVVTKDEADWTLDEVVGEEGADGGAEEEIKKAAMKERIEIVKSEGDAGGVSGPFSCFSCISTMDPKCSDEAWDRKYAQDNFKQLCSMDRPTGEEYADAPVIGCRKVYATVEGEYRTLRQCAFSGPSSLNGQRQSGSDGIIRWFYQCPDAECNWASSAMASLPLLLVAFCALAGLS